MSLKGFFAYRFGVIITITIITYLILPAMPFISPTEHLSYLFLIAGLTTILTMAISYKQLKAKPTEENKPSVHSESDFESSEEIFRMVQDDHLKASDPHHGNPNPDKLGSSEIRELSSTNPSGTHSRNDPKPHTPTKREINGLIKRKFMQQIERGNMDVKVTVEKKGDGKLEIKEATGTIETNGHSTQTTPRAFLGPKRTRRG